MVGKKRALKRGMRTPIGDRVKVLMMIDPKIAADITAVAQEERRAAWSVMEDAARDYLARRHKKLARRKAAAAKRSVD
jgi:hypothetical protein